jgi:ergothioneine biosynthesis protein EgtB
MDASGPGPGPDAYREVRGATEHLCEPLSPEDCVAQSMPDASPAKWHLAHTTWFFETFVLERALPGYRPFEPAFRVMFNSYYNSVGEQHPRPRRGLLTRPNLEAVRAYREHVDRGVLALLERPQGPGGELAAVIEIGLHHEQQHQELILTDVKHLLSHSPLRPAYQKPSSPPARGAPPLRWHGFEAGLCEVGHAGAGFAFDNECPRHRVFVAPFELASRPVTHGEYQAFLDDGGYERPELWLSEGWEAVRSRGWRAPLYWERAPEGWREFTLAGLREPCPDAPVCHVSYYEADAFARWAGVRLPTEQEWELVAAQAPLAGNFVESGLLHPAPAPDALPDAPLQLFGDVWEWTSSAYAAYPGYRPPPGALGEYNGKFMCNQLVLRGGSCASPRSHLRPSYRNFFPPDARWQFSGLRLARDAG